MFLRCISSGWFLSVFPITGNCIFEKNKKNLKHIIQIYFCVRSLLKYLHKYCCSLLMKIIEEMIKSVHHQNIRIGIRVIKHRQGSSTPDNLLQTNNEQENFTKMNRI